MRDDRVQITVFHLQGGKLGLQIFDVLVGFHAHMVCVGAGFSKR